MNTQPAQPSETDWHFVQELQEPLWTRHCWKPRAAAKNEAQLAQGVFIAANFPDDKNVLQTAYGDLCDFLRAGDIPVKSTFDESTFMIETVKVDTGIPESYQIEISEGKVLLKSEDSEGIRRAIFHLEEEMLRAGGPFLPIGEIARTPVIRTRVSRCYFSPIKHPPKNRDELADDVDYYPDQYLNRLAHHGVNGLWLTVDFCDLCPSRFFPEDGKDAARRLEKLRRAVAQCARYGIKIYVFCNEPKSFGTYAHYLASPEPLEKFPQLAGHRDGPLTYFCTSSEEGQEYLESCTYYLFSNVPGLGGLIDINLGEAPTHCYSSTDNFLQNNCPRCSRRSVADVFTDTISALQRGMQRANSDAELIAWLYVPALRDNGENEAKIIKQRLTEIAAGVPPKVLLQVNFESLGTAFQHGRDHQVLDYSLAWVGPSPVFADCARAAINAGARVSAKLQVGNSHEIATVPFVPVPGNLYRKYQQMRQLGVSGAMQCWYFGNYPSPMTAAAGRLSFDPLPETEEEFLRELAAAQWGENAATMAAAWQHFREVYAQFPAVLQFSWFGPVHDSICWPLHLIPVDAVIQRAYKLHPEASGDRVAECFAYEFTRDEIIETCNRMASEWAKGVQLLEKIKSRYENQRENQTEIGVAQALGLQFCSAWNVIRFYALRDELSFAPRDQQLADLETMRGIVREEIENSKKLSLLAQEDSRLGFHSEAEGYKYFPAKLTWRINQLETLLAEDFPAIQEQVEAGKVLFAEFAGINPQGAVYDAKWNKGIKPPDWKVLLPERCGHCQEGDAAVLEKYPTSWKIAADDNNLYINVDCRNLSDTKEQIIVTVEPRRCWPSQKFTVNIKGETKQENRCFTHDSRWSAAVRETDNGWECELTIPWECFRENHIARRPIRINVSRHIPGAGTLNWQPHQPLPRRLIYNDDNPRDYGWVLFSE